MGKVPQGTYTTVFWKFYRSDAKKLRKEYESTENAINAQKSMLRLMSNKCIYDTRISRRGNILYLEKEKGTDFKGQIMRRFLREE